MFAPPLNCAGAFNRGGSYRSEQYTEFFESVDLLNYIVGQYGSAMLLGGRLTHGSEGAGTTVGYVVGYTFGDPRARQEIALAIEFTAEVQSTLPFAYRGGAALISQPGTNRQFRFTMFGTNDASAEGVITSEIYNRTDLLEPLARVRFRNGPSVGTDRHSSGENLIGWLNLDMHQTCDLTFDNYRETAIANTPVGFPGVAQVTNLVPAAQTLFYQPPQNGSNIVFYATTLGSTQIDTNASALRMFLNGTEVTSQLLIYDASLVLFPKSNFLVRYPANLALSTIYQGQIIVLDSTGKGTTNNWVFDTFPTTGTVVIEAEDYNYMDINGVGGTFQDNPPVSGADDTTSSDNKSTVLGSIVGGNGQGYYNVVGSPDIDFHDNNQRGIDANQRNQYRQQDLVGTAQGCNWTGDTPRIQYLTNNVPDYAVAFMDPGDWMNYTRTFTSGNYKVYLRAACQGRQDVRLDQVTSSRSVSNQTTVLRGQFLVPNTGSSTRYRYVPLTDEAGNIQTLSISGVTTFRLTANQVRWANVVGDELGDMELNYFIFVPTTDSASTGAWLASVSPSANSDNFGPDSTITVGILNRGSTVSCPGGIQLWLNGSNVTSFASISCTTTDGPGATVTFRPPMPLPRSTNTLAVVFNDGTIRSNQWSFTIDPNMPLITPADASGGPPDTLFAIKSVKGPNDTSTECTLVNPFGNTTARAERHLAGDIINPTTLQPFPNEATGAHNGHFYTENLETNAVQYEQCGGSTPNFGQGTPYPGIPTSDTINGTYDCATGTDPNRFAIAASINLQLGPGVYRMGVNSDDEFKVTAGGIFGTNVYLGSSETMPGEREFRQGVQPEFDFAVQSNGVYQIRMIHEEGSGGAHCEWYWVNRTTGTRELVRPLALDSAASVKGPFAMEAAAFFNPSAKTVTVPKSGTTRFYRLRSSTGYTLGKPVMSGGNVVLSYQ